WSKRMSHFGLQTPIEVLSTQNAPRRAGQYEIDRTYACFKPKTPSINADVRSTPKAVAAARATLHLNLNHRLPLRSAALLRSVTKSFFLPLAAEDLAKCK